MNWLVVFGKSHGLIHSKLLKSIVAEAITATVAITTSSKGLAVATTIIVKTAADAGVRVIMSLRLCRLLNCS